MAVPFLNSITLNKNEVQDFKVYNIGTGNPTLSSGGDIGYFWTDTTGSASARVLKWWDGSNVRTILDSASTTVVAADLSGGAAGSLPYQQGANDTTFLGIGTAGQVLKVNSGATAPEWTAQSNLSVGTATFLAGGTTGDIPVQSAAGTTGFLNIGANGRILTSNGSTPVWSATIPSSSVSGLAASATTDTTNAANITSGLLPLARLALATGQFYLGDASNNPVATAKTSIPLSGFGAAGADVAMGGFKITGLADPVDATDAANRKYVDEVAQGLDVKASCLVATIANIDLSAPGSSIDGISLASSNRVLVKDQTDKKQNGIYVWNGAAVAMTRSLDADTVAKLVGAFTFVEQGTNADSGWVCQVDSGTIGSVDIEWTKFSQAGAYDAGNGMVLSSGKFHFAQDTNYTAGRIPFASGNTTIGFSSNLFWDNGNNRLGIGTPTPGYTLDVNGAINVANNNFIRSGNNPLIASNGSTFNYYYTGSTALKVRNNADTSDLLYLSNSGNLGLGVTPSAWWSGIKAQEFGSGSNMAAISGQTNAPFLRATANVYLDSSLVFRYKTTYFATSYQQDATTGIHSWFTAPSGSAGAEITAFSSAKMTLDASGRLGIGTATPNRILSLAGGASNALIHFTNTSSGTTNNDGFTFGLETDNRVVLFNGEATSMEFYTAGTLRATLDSSGNLGLGVTPVAWGIGKALEIGFAGCSFWGISATRTAVGSNFYHNGSNYYYISASSNAAARFELTSGAFQWHTAPAGTSGNVAVFTQAMTLDASGNLGVGAATPAAKLDVATTTGFTWQAAPTAGVHIGTRGTAGGSLMVQTASLNSNYGSGLAVDGTYNSGKSTINLKAFGVYSGGPYSSDIAFFTSTETTLSEKMRLDNAGVLLFKTNGTASAPTIANADNPDTGLYWPTDNDTLALAVGGSDAVYIDANRRVGIGISSSIAATLHVEGAAAQARFSTAAASDARHEYYRNGVREAYINWDLDTFQIYGTKSGGSLLLGTNSTERLRIKSTGQINLVGLNSAPTGAVGDLYYNSTSNTLQYHNNSAFQQLSRKVSAAGAGTGTTITVTHNFGTKDVIVQVRDSSDAQVLTDVSYATNSVTVTFASSQTLSNYTVTVIG